MEVSLQPAVVLHAVGEGVADDADVVAFFDFELFGLELFIASGGVAGGGFAFLARLGALDGDDFAGHRAQGGSAVVRQALGQRLFADGVSGSEVPV